jgi:hypothetical protein
MISRVGLVAQHCRIANSVVINCFTLISIRYITKSSQHHITTASAVINLALHFSRELQMHRNSQ